MRPTGRFDQTLCDKDLERAGDAGVDRQAVSRPVGRVEGCRRFAGKGRKDRPLVVGQGFDRRLEGIAHPSDASREGGRDIGGRKRLSSVGIRLLERLVGEGLEVVGNVFGRVDDRLQRGCARPDAAVAEPRRRLRKIKLLDFAYSIATRRRVDREQPRQVAVRAAVGGLEGGTGGVTHAPERGGVGEKIAQDGSEGGGVAG